MPVGVIEPVLDRILCAYEVPVLHAKEFNDTKGAFAHWSRVKKHSFATELFSSIHGRVMGISMSMRVKAFLDAKKNKKIPQNMSAYGICFSTIMLNLIMQPQIGQLIISEGLSFLIESGNKNNGEVEKFFHKMSKLPSFKGGLKSITFLQKYSCRSIQLADFLAFYSRQHMRNTDRFGGQLALPVARYLEIMMEHVPIHEWIATGFEEPPLGHMDKLPDFGNRSAWSDIVRSAKSRRSKQRS